MNWLTVSTSHLKEKKLNSGLSILLMSFGVGIILILLILSAQVQDSFEKNIKGIDMVLGSKGSPLQIILSSVYHMDNPTGNISCAEAQTIANNKMIKTAIPLAYGDSYQGYRIVGTTPNYLNLYQAKVKNGLLFNEPFQIVLGAQAATVLNLKVGDKIVGNHGLTENTIEKHEEHPYIVSGILAPNNSVLDQLILTSVNSVWSVHSHGIEKHQHQHGIAQSVQDLDSAQEITALLLQFKSPMAVFSLPRIINANTKMQAALPAIEINRLIGLLGIGITTLKAIALLIISLSGASVFISLLSNLKDKKYELALLRSFGASRLKLFRVIVQEGLILTLLGYILGVILSRLALFVIGTTTEKSMLIQELLWKLTWFDGMLLLVSFGLGIVSSIIPAIRAYNLNISETLSHD